jgi:hypothetical protein
MKNNRYFIFIILFTILFSSCEKDEKVDNNDQDDQEIIIPETTKVIGEQDAFFVAQNDPTSNVLTVFL